MRDPRFKTLACSLLDHSVQLRPGDKVALRVFGWEIPLCRVLVEEIYARGGLPFLMVRNNEVLSAIYKSASSEQLDLMAHVDKELLGKMDAVITIVAEDNPNEMGEVPGEQMALWSKHYRGPVIKVALARRWVLLGYPNYGMASAAGMSTGQFEDFYFDVSTLDYAKMDRAMDPLKELMERTDQVRLVGPGTDLRFSIKGLPAIKCSGRHNIPDGEIFTAPVRNSVNGRITYNVPSRQDGFTFESVSFEFAEGKIVQATANDTERLRKALDVDEGARYIGEFSFGVNPFITSPMKDILFDEKISGSIHFTPGEAYEECDNGNRSTTHWDLVMIQTPEYGGGQIWFDDVLIRQDGRFVLDSLQGLNPENLK